MESGTISSARSKLLLNMLEKYIYEAGKIFTFPQFYLKKNETTKWEIE